MFDDGAWGGGHSHAQKTVRDREMQFVGTGDGSIYVSHVLNIEC